MLARNFDRAPRKLVHSSDVAKLSGIGKQLRGRIASLQPLRKLESGGEEWCGMGVWGGRRVCR